MRRIKEVLRLRVALGDNVSAIAAGARVARSSVRKYLKRAAAAGIDAAAAENLTDDVLEAALFPTQPLPGDRAEPDWAAIDLDLRRNRHVTLKLVWMEYKAAHPDGFGLTQFKHHYAQWRKEARLGLSMHQTHRQVRRAFGGAERHAHGCNGRASLRSFALVPPQAAQRR